jgi:hypothetical protein
VSDTPRTDAVAEPRGEGWEVDVVPVEFARQIERDMERLAKALIRYVLMNPEELKADGGKVAMEALKWREASAE